MRKMRSMLVQFWLQMVARVGGVSPRGRRAIRRFRRKNIRLVLWRKRSNNRMMENLSRSKFSRPKKIMKK